jgi:dihydroflavonol-4-reductase
MENISGFAAEMEGCDVLFHTAAYFREYYGPGDHWAKLKQINVDGTIRQLDEVEKRGIKRVIYTSSSGVIGGTPDGRPGDESTPPDKFVEENLYFKSKVLAEQAIADWLKAHSLPVVLILPTAMIGPSDAAPTSMGQAIVDLVERSIPAIPPGGFSFVDVRDVAQAMINAVERGRPGERYIVSEAFHTMAQLAWTIERVSGVPAPRLHLPYLVVLGIATLSERVAKRRGTAPRISVSAIRSMRLRREVSAQKAKRELGATFRSFEESLRDEVVWYQQHGYVKVGQVKRAGLSVARPQTG